MSFPVRNPPPTPPVILGHALRVGDVSWIPNPRLLVVSAVTTALAVLLFLVSIGVSDYPLSPIDVGRILLGGGTRIENVVVISDALPRAMICLLVGFGLGMAGALMQLIARNPLATPDILGITAGASAAAVLAIAFGSTWGAWFQSLGIPMATLIGGLGTGVVMYILAWPGRGANAAISPFRLVLIGVGMTWMLQAAVAFLLTRANIQDVAAAQMWIVGSVAQSSWSRVWPVAIAVLVAIVVVVVTSSQRDALGLGPDIARGLGVRVGAASTTILLTAVAVAALSVSAAGPIGFVALLAPQIALRIASTSVPTPLVAGITGSVLVLAGDLLCRTLLPGLPVGVVTAALGGPFLIYLMITMSRKATA